MKADSPEKDEAAEKDTDAERDLEDMAEGTGVIQ